MELHVRLQAQGRRMQLRAARGVGCFGMCASGIGVNWVPHWTQAGKFCAQGPLKIPGSCLVRDWTLPQCYHWGSYKITGLFAVKRTGSNSGPYKQHGFILSLVLTSISTSKGIWAQLMAVSRVLWVPCLLYWSFPIACKWWIEVCRSHLLGKSSQACASLLLWNRKGCCYFF